MSENVMPEKFANLTYKQMRALQELLRGGSIGNASKLARVSERQIYRWMREDEFRTALDTSTSEAITAAGRALSDASIGAVIVLRTIANDSKARREDAVRVRAASAILSHALRWKELLQFEERLAALEAQLIARGAVYDNSHKNQES